MAIVRKLTESGITQFVAYIKRLSLGEVIDPPFHLLTSDETSAALMGTAEIDETVVLDTKLIAAKYLHQQLSTLDRGEIEGNIGLWSWLSLFYFDQVCPAPERGVREPGEIARHVLSDHSQKYYRHLLAGPYRLFQLHGDSARVFLYGPLPEHGDFSEQLASRMQFITNRSLISAISQLYFDPHASAAGRPKRGALTRSRPGNLRRLIAVVQQFDLTYDMYAMTASQILDLLPGEEFSRWRSAPSTT
jgi:hypothetical protein